VLINEKAETPIEQAKLLDTLPPFRIMNASSIDFGLEHDGARFAAKLVRLEARRARCTLHIARSCARACARTHGRSGSSRDVSHRAEHDTQDGDAAARHD
jgi:hypothetical protein